jgi:acyl-CoA synthetase (AMP-forming)/AMP-acid ligase II
VKLSESQVIDHAREHLASYKTPRSVSFLGEIPRNGSARS